MHKREIYGLILLLIPWGMVAQISPGKLAQDHTHLEGISNCTQCHVLGRKVSDDKCLACHDKISDLITLERGLHANADARSKSCFECHSDHHGLRFDMARFDEETFDHKVAGYELIGEHARIDCRNCHKPDYITETSLKKRSQTFLGLEKTCVSCHIDFHQGSLSENCLDCHDYEAFRPAPLFKHDQTEYPLTGAHTRVDCKSCHEVTQLNEREYQVFSGVEFNDCTACHQDPHRNHFRGQCKQCHTEESFHNLSKLNTFNHNTTSFPLRSSHRRVSCFDCHKDDKNPATLFQDQLGIKPNQCSSCHEDIHDGKFSKDCAQCHRETDFNDLKNLDVFNHNLTDYPLRGQHIGLDCKSCHEQRFTDPIDFALCKNCHEDYHQGEFDNKNPPMDCANCHSVLNGFEISHFSLEDHTEADFPLDGAHLATPCFECHRQEERWTFSQLGSVCIDCHEDVHDGHIDITYYPEHDCRSCHATGSWAEIDFDHELTEWALQGSHALVECKDCHFEVSENSNILEQSFQSLEQECTNCHEHFHGDQFIENGTTDCLHCHNYNLWSPSIFDHNQSSFPLDGKHSKVACNDCHKPIYDNGINRVEYKMQSYRCIDCHQ